jgi:WD40 repeat protein
VWNLSNLKSLQVLGSVHDKPIRNAIWSNYETEIVSISYDQSCALTDVETGKEVSRFRHSDILTAVSAKPNDEHTILIGSTNCVLNWDTRVNNQTKASKTYAGPVGLVQDILFLKEKEFVTCGDVVNRESAQYSVVVWDFESSAQISTQIFHEKYICTCLRQHPAHSLFYALTHGNYIVEFSSRQPFKMNKYKRYQASTHRTAGYYIGFDVNSSGNLLASGSLDGSVYIYDVKTSKLLHRVEAFNRKLVDQPCMDVKFKPNQSDQATSSTNNRPVIAASCFNGMIKILQF